jgi:spore maturation protein CgeB
MRILLLNPNYINRHNWGHQLFKNEIGRQHDVTYYGEGYEGFDRSLTVPQILNKLDKKFDIILTYESKYSKDFKKLNKVKNIPKVLIQIDYALGIENYQGFAKTETINYLIKRNSPDLIFATSTSNVSTLKNNLGMEKVFFLPFSVDTNIYRNLSLNRNIDVMAVYNTNNYVYPNRKKIQRMIKSMKIKSFITKVIHNEYVKKLNESKIFIINNNINKRLSMKYTEAMACGTFVLADEPEDLNIQGFKNNEHLILYSDLNDLKQKINYYLKNDEERKRISKNGMKFVHKNHSCFKRVQQFTDIIMKELHL